MWILFLYQHSNRKVCSKNDPLICGFDFVWLLMYETSQWCFWFHSLLWNRLLHFMFVQIARLSGRRGGSKTRNMLPLGAVASQIFGWGTRNVTKSKAWITGEYEYSCFYVCSELFLHLVTFKVCQITQKYFAFSKFIDERIFFAASLQDVNFV